MLSSKSQYEKAHEVAEVGWKQCLSLHTSANAANETLVNWDAVDT